MSFQKFLLLVYKKFFFLFQFFEILENIFLKKKLKSIDKNRNDYLIVCGYPRSGTTYFTNFIKSQTDFTSITFKYYPLINIPMIWGGLSKYYYNGNRVKRMQNDNIYYDRDTAESFDEIYLSNYLIDNKFKILDETYKNDELERNYKIFLKKILLAESKKKIVLKNNYHILRVRYLTSIIDNLKIIILFRNPIEHIQSIIRVNKILEGNENKKNAYELLSFNEHYEFGEIKRSLELKNQFKTDNYWKKNDLYNGYLCQWIDIYEYVLNNYSQLKNVCLIDYKHIKYKDTKKIRELVNKIDITLDLNDFNSKFKNESYENENIGSQLIDKYLLEKAESLYIKLSSYK